MLYYRYVKGQDFYTLLYVFKKGNFKYPCTYVQCGSSEIKTVLDESNSCIVFIPYISQ